MQKKVFIGIIALVVIAAGAYAIFHKSSNPYSSTASNDTTSSNSSGQNTASNSGTIIQTKTADNIGKYLADANGNALYTYGGDTKGVSNCSGSCLSSWPIYSAANAPATLPTNVSVVTRSDGTKQYAYKSMPLYTFTGDSNGQVTGDNISDFHLAKP